MAENNKNLKLLRMNEMETQAINWLWYPYIPFGKITVIQGDPGDRKTTAVLAIAAAVTTGTVLPETKNAAGPTSVISPKGMLHKGTVTVLYHSALTCPARRVGTCAR